MEHPFYPISLFCKDARLSLQKAASARVSGLVMEELQHLRDFQSIVSETIPSHPLYTVNRDEKEILELQFYLSNVIKRLAKLEGENPSPCCPLTTLRHKDFSREKGRLRRFTARESSSKQRRSSSVYYSTPPCSSKSTTPLGRSPSLRNTLLLSSNKHKFEHSDGAAKPRSPLGKHVDKAGHRSPRATSRNSVNQSSGLNTQSLHLGEDAVTTLVEGFAVHNDDFNTTEKALNSVSLYDESIQQRLQPFVADFYSERGRILSESVSCDNASFSKTSDNCSQTVCVTRSARKNDKGCLDGSFQDLGCAVEHFVSKERLLKSKGSQIPKEEQMRAKFAMTENLEAALDQLGSLHASNGGSEVDDFAANEERPQFKAQERVAVNNKRAAYMSTSSRRVLVGEDVAVEQSRLFNAAGVPEISSKEHAQECITLSLSFDTERGQNMVNKMNMLRDKESVLKSAGRQQGDSWNVLNGIDGIDHGFQNMKVKAKKTFGSWMGERSFDGDLGRDGVFHRDNTQLKTRHRHVTAGNNDDAVSQLDKFQVKHFLGKEEHTLNFDDGKLDGEELDNKPIHSLSLIPEEVASPLSSFTSCGAVSCFPLCTENHRILNVEEVPLSSRQHLPSWALSFFNKLDTQSLSLLPDEADAQFNLHPMYASNPQQTTFCNPVFDFDSTISSKLYPESISRPILDTCDADDGKFESVHKHQSHAGENTTGTKNSADGSSIVLKDVQNGISSVPNDLVGHFACEKDAVRYLELTKRMDNFQSALNELKAVVQCSNNHLNDQADLWQGHMKSLERDLDIVKMESSSEIVGLKMLIKNKMNLKRSQVNEGLCASSKGMRLDNYLEEKTDRKLEECTLRCDSLHKQMDSWLSRIPEDIKQNVAEVVEASMKKIGSSLRTEIERLELQRLRDFGNLKKEMELKFNLHENKEHSSKIAEKQLESIMQKNLEKQFLHFAEVFSPRKERFVEVKNEISSLWKEVEALHKERVQLQEKVKTMADFVEMFKLDKCETSFNSDYDFVMKQLQVVRKEGMQVRFLVESLKRERDAEVGDMKQSIEKLKAETAKCQENMMALEKERTQGQLEVEALKKFKDELEGWRSILRDETSNEGSFIMEKVEVLSQLYLGGLEEVRTELLSFKISCQSTIEELERLYEESVKITKGSFLNSLETRILELEKEHNCTQILEKKAEDILALEGQHRKLASAAATDAAASAHKAEESFNEMLNFVSSEINSSKRKSSKLQDSIASDRETSSTLLFEKMTISADLCKEHDGALAAASAAKKKSHELVEWCEQEVSNSRLYVGRIEKDKESLSKLSTEIMSLAAQARNVLREMMEVKQNSLDLSKEVLTELMETKRRGMEVSEEVMAELVNLKQKSMRLSEEVVDEMANARRKTSELGQEVLGEITNVRKKNVQMQEAAADVMAVLQTKAGELLTDITCTKRCTQMHYAAVAEAASWAAQAEELIAEIRNSSHNLQCKEAATEAAAFASTAEQVLAEMMKMKWKSTQLYDNMNEMVGHVIKMSQEQCEKDTMDFKKTFECEVRRAKSCNEEIEQVMTTTLAPSRIACMVLTDEFGQHVSKTDLSLKELSEAVKQLANSAKILKIGFEGHDQIKHDIRCVNQRVATVLSMLESVFHLNGSPEEKQQQGMMPKCLNVEEQPLFLELEKKLSSLELVQTDLVCKVEKINCKMEEFEKSVAVWVPKYDAAAKVLGELESRLGILETSTWNDAIPGKRSEVDEKDLLLHFYKDLAGKSQSPELNNIDGRDKGLVKFLDSRMVILENRIEHVASATYTNLRILDTKVEHVNGIFEMALENASMAERKCNFLGAELVKVFRLFANSTKVSPGKNANSSEANAKRSSACSASAEALIGKKREHFLAARLHQKKPVVQGVKVLPMLHHNATAEKSIKKPQCGNKKGQHTHKVDGPCDSSKSYIDKSNVKGSIAAGKHICHHPSGSTKSFDVIRFNVETVESDDGYAPCKSHVTRSQSGTKSEVDFSFKVPQTFTGFQLNKSDNIFSEDISERIHQSEMDLDTNANHLRPGKDSQKTNFHLASGRLLVNVSHKSHTFS